MGWGTSFNAEIYLSKKTFENKAELMEEIRDTEEKITYYKTKLLLFAVSTPKDIIMNIQGFDNEDNIGDIHEIIIDIINEDASFCVSELTDLTMYLTKLDLFLEHLEDNPDVDINDYYPFKDVKDDGTK